MLVHQECPVSMVIAVSLVQRGTTGPLVNLVTVASTPWA